MARNAERTLADVVADVVRLLVDNPQDVKVLEVTGSQSTLLELTVRDGDRGQVIGKGGKIADALRTILAAASGRSHKNIRLEIND